MISLLVFVLELLGRAVPEARMRPILVVVPTPGFDDDPSLGAVAEPLHAQALVAELAVEAFRRAILPRLARFDIGRLDARLLQPA